MLWSEETHRSRLLMYELCALLVDCNNVEKLAVVEAIEETGNVVFTLTKKITRSDRGTDRH